ncbi:50S ribosomal protein L25/general stress protein Ctc [Trueperella sp. LYQ143]|uniref:50S ribosomal protein L25/general stress protein Ctc n=1 Tax=unclassified Trueperella TaxID=2630174 RepID=UPI003983206C
MASKPVLEATRREEFGKGAARRMRREGLMPVVVYGHGQDPEHFAVDYHDAYMLVRSNPNALFTLKVDGANQLVMAKDVQRNPLSRRIEHLDLLRVKADEKVDVDVAVELSGEPQSGAIATVEMMTIAVKAPATDVPTAIVVDVEGMEDGTQVRVGDLALPEGVTTEIDAEEIVVVIAIPQEVDLPETEEADAEEEAEEAAE